MATPWSIPRMWEGATVAILASGPSMSQSVADSVRGKMRVVAINNTARLAPDADVVYACDAKCWAAYPDMLEASGIKVTLDPAVPQADVMLLQNDGTSGYRDDQMSLKTGHNSGFQALQLAIKAGAQRILLFGFDMRGKHWFGEHPDHLQDKDDHLFDRFIGEFEKVAPAYERMGVDVVNCTPGSALTCFRTSTLENEMAEKKAPPDPVEEAAKSPDQIAQDEFDAQEQANFDRINLVLALQHG